jgi:hypothetical protein
VNPLAPCIGVHKWIFLERQNLALVDERGVYKESLDPQNQRVYATFDIFYCEHCLTYAKVQIGTHYAVEWYLEHMPTLRVRALVPDEDA